MRKVFLGAALFTLFAGPSIAADIARPVYKAAPVVAPAYNWTGFYVGVNAGWAWSDSDLRLTPNAPLTAPGGLGDTIALLVANQPTRRRADGFTGGGQIGYNWQTDNWVFGWEADFNYIDLKHNFNFASGIPAASTTVGLTGEFSADWFATLRARVGWASGPWLAYVTGGLAVSRLTLVEAVNVTTGAGPGVFNASKTDTKWGWTIGGGLEWAIGPQWTAKVEYLYVDFGDINAVGPVSGAIAPLIPGAAVSYHADLTASIVRVGLNYRF
jgi:outer membrane immunogenic protein